MQPFNLHLPTFAHQIAQRNDGLCIFDVVRRKWLQLTPEEWVRQHFVHYLIGFGYSKAMMRTESGVAVGNLQKRSDIVVYNSAGNPWLVVECKAPFIALTDATLQQALHYNSSLKAPFLALTNGIEHRYYGFSENGIQLLSGIEAISKPI
jgi:Type I restriction enzyme R protein N terminus (HSDR_N)